MLREQYYYRDVSSEQVDLAYDRLYLFNKYYSSIKLSNIIYLLVLNTKKMI